MKKKIIGIALCVLLLAVIPTAAGLNIHCEKDTGDLSEPTPILPQRIVMRGIILNPHTTFGGQFAFFALRVTYKSFGLQGMRTGTLFMKRVVLEEPPNGLITNGYLFTDITVR